MRKMYEKSKEKKKGNQGFTLVEIVIVLVIIAILSTLLIGALSGYIDKANEKKLVADTRAIVVAAQTIVSEKYAEGDDSIVLGAETPLVGDIVDEIFKLSGANLDVDQTQVMIMQMNGKITYVEVPSPVLEKVCVYDGEKGTLKVNIMGENIQP